MEKRGIVLIIVLIIAGLIAAGFIAGWLLKEEENKGVITIEDNCTADSDCVPNVCCHAKNCIAKADEPKCEGIMCTQDCEPGTLDCGQGQCKCENKMCKAVIG